MKRRLLLKGRPFRIAFLLTALCVFFAFILPATSDFGEGHQRGVMTEITTTNDGVRIGVDLVFAESKEMGSPVYEPTSPGTVTIHGYCYYLDDANRKQRIKYATVNLYDKTWYLVDRLLTDIYGNPASTWTNSEGYYEFNPVENVDELGGSGTLDVFIELVCDSGAVKVVPVLPINVWPYRGYSSVFWDVPDGTTTITLTVNDPEKKGCWGIYHSIIDAYEETERKVGYRIPKVIVVWPWLTTATWELFDLGYVGIESGWEWNPDTILHEYGHWAMDQLYGGLPIISALDYGFPDFTHSWYSQETLKVAWVEGWANFYSVATRNDRYFWSYDLESQWPTGDNVEGAIACILWDIYDSADDGRDTLSLDLEEIWFTVRYYQPVDIHEFWDNFIRDFHREQQMWGIYYDHGINKDSKTPSNPNSWSGSHSRTVWSSDNTIEVTWSGASDDLSGVYGYSFVWDSSSSTIPDTTIDTTGTTSVSQPLSTGNSWYLHIRTRDIAGNWNPSAFHVGPFYVDTSSPNAPSVSESHCDTGWTTHNSPYFTWSNPGDQGSGISFYEGSIDSGSPTTVSSPYHPTWSDGIYSFKVRSVDGVGLKSGWSNAITVKIDTTPPVGIAQINSDAPYTTSTSVALTVEAVDGKGSGVAQMRFRNEGESWGNWLTYATSTSWNLRSGDGNKRVYVQFKDYAGLTSEESESYDDIILDTAPPSMPVPNDGVSGWSKDNTPTFTWSPSSDAGSGVAGYYWKVDAGSETWTTSTSVTLPPEADGSHTFYVKAKDNAGLLSGWSSHGFQIDTTTPSTPNPDDGVEEWSNDNTPTFTWSPSTDAESGVAGYYWKINGGSETWTTSTSVAPPSQPDGSHAFYVKAKDNAGNIGDWGSHDFLIDTAAPSTPSPDDGVEGWSNDNTPTFTWSPSSDSHSGVAGYYWRVDSGSETWTTPTSVTLPPQLDGSHTFYVKAKDNAGNVGSWGSHGFQIDTSVPSTPGPDDGVEGWSNGNMPTFTWSPSTDAGSGVAGYLWKVDSGSETWTTSTSVSLPSQSDGSRTFYVKAKDNVGNVGSWGSHGFQIDTTPPNNPNIHSSSHSEEVWSNDDTIDVEWSDASDAPSGIYGYSFEWSTSSSTVPDQTVDTTGTSTTSPPLSDSDSWYFHVRTKDNAGNWASDAYHVGPFYIDTDSPTYSNESPTRDKKYDNDTSNIRLQIDWEDLSSGVSSVNFHYKYDSGSWSGWLSPSDSSGDTYWYDIPQSEWINHIEKTLYWESKATDNAGSTSFTPAFTGSALVDDDITPPEINHPSSSFVTETDVYRIQIDALDPSGIGIVKFRYQFGIASYFEWYNFTGSSGDTYWYDIPKEAWETHTGETIIWQAYAEDGDGDKPNDYASNMSTEYVMYYLAVSTNPPEVDSLPVDNGMGWYDLDELAYAKCAPEVYVGTDMRSFFMNWGGDATGNNPTSEPMIMDGPKIAIANYKTQYRVSIETMSDDSSFLLHPAQIQVYGAPPNGTIITLKSYSNIWLDNVQWTVKRILWKGNNVVPDPNPQFSPTPGGTWVIVCRVYRITSITFNDYSGKELYASPTHVTITTPNNTDISLSSFTSLVLYLQNGTYTFKTITWQSNNVVDSPPQTFDPTDGNPSINCRVYSLKVTCKDNSEQPLDNASLTIQFPNGTVLMKYSDADGIYYMGHAQNGSYSITVNWQDVSVGAALLQVDSDADENIPCCVYMLTVHVRDEIGQPLGDAVLYLFRNETLLNGEYGLSLTPTTDSEGYYTWQQISEQIGSYKVKAVFAGNGVRKVGWSDEQPLTDDVTSVNAWPIQVIPIVSVSVRTVDWDEGVLSRAHVEIIINKTVQAWGNTDPNGWINFTDIVPGNLTFNAFWTEVKVNQTTVGLAFDSIITLRCKVYNVTIGFRDADDTAITNPSEYVLEFQNGTDNLVKVFAFRCPIGNMTLKSATWHGSEVAPSPNCRITVNASQQYFFPLDIFNPTFSVRERDQVTPIEQAIVCIRFPNGTSTSYSTDSTGEITLEIQKGFCDINVTTIEGCIGHINYPIQVNATKTYEIPTCVGSEVFTVIFDETGYEISVIANSTVSGFNFSSTEKRMDFEVSGSADTMGACNITIPKGLVASPSDLKVYVDGRETDFTLTENTGSYYVYVMYQHSTHIVTISFMSPSPPSIPLWILLPVVIAVSATIAAMMIIKRRPKKEWIHS